MQGLSYLQNSAFGLSSPRTNVNGRMSYRVYSKDRVSWSLQTYLRLVAGNSFLLAVYPWYFWWNQFVIWRVWRCGIQSNGGVICQKIRYDLKPHQPGNDKNRAGSMAMWVAPIRMYDHLSREIPFVLKSIDDVPYRETVADPNRRWYTFDTLKRNEWSVMWGPGCKTFLLNPVYSSLEIHYRKVDPYLVKSESNSQ